MVQPKVEAMMKKMAEETSGESGREGVEDGEKEEVDREIEKLVKSSTSAPDLSGAGKKAGTRRSTLMKRSSIKKRAEMAKSSTVAGLKLEGEDVSDWDGVLPGVPTTASHEPKREKEKDPLGFISTDTEIGRKLKKLLIESDRTSEEWLRSTWKTSKNTPEGSKQKDESRTNRVNSELVITPVKQREINRQKAILHRLHKEYNLGFALLNQLTKQCEDLKREYQDMVSMDLKITKTGEMQTIKDKIQAERFVQYQTVHAKLVQTTAYNQTLEHMRHRLESYKALHDSELESLKQAIAEVKKDFGASNLLLRESQNMRQLAAMELDRLQIKAAEELLEWKERFDSRQEIVAHTRKIMEFREDQSIKKTAIIAEVKGDLDAEGEQKLQGRVVTNKMKQMRLANDLIKRSEKIDEYERAFKKIVNATGISDINEVVEKYIRQEETRSNLKSMIVEAEARIQAMMDEKGKIVNEVEEIRFSGLGHLNKQRKILDDKEEVLASTVRQTKHVQSKSEYLRTVVYSMKLTIENLKRQLDEFSIKDSNADKGGENGGAGPSASNSGPGQGFLGNGPVLGLAALAGIVNGGLNAPSTNSGDAKPDTTDSQVAKTGSLLTSEVGATGNSTNSNDTNQLANSVGLGSRDSLLEAIKSCEGKLARLINQLPSTCNGIHDLDEETINRFTRDRIVVASKSEEESLSNGQDKDGESVDSEDHHANSKSITLSMRAKRNNKRKTKLSKRSGKSGDNSKHELASHSAQGDNIESSLEKNETKRGSFQESPEAGSIASSSDDASIGESEEEQGYGSSSSEEYEDGDEPVVANKAGRALIKAEAERLVRFAEKKRKRLTKMLESPNHKNSPKLSVLVNSEDKLRALEQHVESLTRAEARKSSILKSKRKHTIGALPRPFGGKLSLVSAQMPFNRELQDRNNSTPGNDGNPNLASQAGLAALSRKHTKRIQVVSHHPGASQSSPQTNSGDGQCVSNPGNSSPTASHRRMPRGKSKSMSR